MEINCPKCGTNEIIKNDHRRDKQNYQCKHCGRQFIESYSEIGYPQQVKEDYITMYLSGNGFRAIERITKVNHNTVIRHWNCYFWINFGYTLYPKFIPDGNHIISKISRYFLKQLRNENEFYHLPQWEE